MTAQSLHTLAVTKRDTTTPNQLRQAGKLPAVVYGTIKEPISLIADAREFTKLYKEIGGNTIVKLEIADEKAVKVLIHDVQVHPVRGEVLHVDFFAVNMKEKIRTEVPLELTGEAPAVEVLGGTLITVKSEVEIEALPDQLPSEFILDVTKLATFDDVIRVSDIIIPEGVTMITDADEVLVSVSEPRSEEELAELDEAPAATIETEFGTKEGSEEAPAEEAK
jgi:large subunit ribosomal protein L25